MERPKRSSKISLSGNESDGRIQNTGGGKQMLREKRRWRGQFKSWVFLQENFTG